MNSARVTTGTLLALALASAIPAAAQDSPRAVVELFTSQGCSSCPAADKLLGEMAGDRSILTMSLSVDYWDYLGWKDTLALKAHSTRQRVYAKTRGDRQVYTPQAVVNGTAHVVGSDRAAIDSAITRTRSLETLSLPVKVTVGADTITITAAPTSADAPAAGEVWLCGMTREVTVKIAKGENRGRLVTYHNVVRRWVKVGAWTGGAQTWTVSKADIADGDTDSLAVLVQAGSAEHPGTVLGAAQASLR